MYLLGHVASAVILYTIYEYWVGEFNDRNKLIIGIGSMLPDLLDKPIGSLIFNSGRWLGHSILFQLIVFILLTIILHVKQPYDKFGSDRKLLYVGATIHLFGDMPGISLQTLFWPFFGPFANGSKEGFLYGFESPFIIITEILGLTILLSIGVLQKWTRIKWAVLGIIVVSYASLYVSVYSLLVGF